MIATERALDVPVWLWLPLAALIVLALAWHAWVAPRLIERRHWKRLAALRDELGIAPREGSR